MFLWQRLGVLLELSRANAVHLGSVSTLVLDEADKILNLGFKDEMDQIFKLLPKKRQNLLFSATLSSEVQNVEKGLLSDPTIVKIEQETEEEILIQQVGLSCIC